MANGLANRLQEIPRIPTPAADWQRIPLQRQRYPEIITTRARPEQTVSAPTAHHAQDYRPPHSSSKPATLPQGQQRAHRFRLPGTACTATAGEECEAGSWVFKLAPQAEELTFNRALKRAGADRSALQFDQLPATDDEPTLLTVQACDLSAPGLQEIIASLKATLNIIRARFANYKEKIQEFLGSFSEQQSTTARDFLARFQNNLLRQVATPIQRYLLHGSGAGALSLPSGSLPAHVASPVQDQISAASIRAHSLALEKLSRMGERQFMA